MALDADRLKTALKASHLAALQAAFPAPPGLLAPELALFNENQDKLATALSVGDSATTVTEITDNAEVTSAGNTGTGTPGGPLPIAALPGTVA